MYTCSSKPIRSLGAKVGNSTFSLTQKSTLQIYRIYIRFISSRFFLITSHTYFMPYPPFFTLPVNMLCNSHALLLLDELSLGLMIWAHRCVEKMKMSGGTQLFTICECVNEICVLKCSATQYTYLSQDIHLLFVSWHNCLAPSIIKYFLVLLTFFSFYHMQEINVHSCHFLKINSKIKSYGTKQWNLNQSVRKHHAIAYLLGGVCRLPQWPFPLFTSTISAGRGCQLIAQWKTGC